MIIKSPFFDPFRNLAIEEFLLDNLPSGLGCLLFYRNDDAIIIGKHQNPWLECPKVDAFEAEGGRLARRVSGGGCVYHDRGNLNFSFIFPKDQFNIEQQLKDMNAALNSMKIPSHINKRRDLVLYTDKKEERKFSGNSFCMRKNFCLHHGTLLIHSDLTRLGKFLHGAELPIESNSVRSFKSKVVNLSEFNEFLSVDEIQNGIVKYFTKHKKISKNINLKLDENLPLGEIILDWQKIAELENKHKSWEWRFGKTPKFIFNIDKTFGWGNIGLKFHVQDAFISNLEIKGKSITAKAAHSFVKGLTGIPFNFKKITRSLGFISISTKDLPSAHMADITNLILEKSEAIEK